VATLLSVPIGYWSPVVGTPTLPERPSLAVAGGRWAGVPVLIGTTRDEGLGFVADAYRSTPLDAARFSALLAQVAGPRAAAAAAAYPVDGRDPTALWAQVMGDRGYSCPNLAAYATFAAQVPTFAYEFGTPPDAAAHSTELPYLFTITGGQPTFSPPEEALSTAVRGYWTAFATAGDPGPTWPRFGAAGPVLTLAVPGVRTASAAEFAAAHHCDVWS
jgi:para-nitrobenzyl esterase